MTTNDMLTLSADSANQQTAELTAIIDSLFYQLYQVVAGEYGNPNDACYAITSVHADIISIAKGEL